MEGRSQTNYDAAVSTLGVREKVFNPKYNSATGIPFVIVNGVTVVRESQVLEDVFPGQAIRLPLKQ